MKNLSIRKKLPLLLILVGIAPLVILGVLLFGQIKDVYVKSVLFGLMNFVDAKQQGVIRFLDQNRKLSSQLGDLADQITPDNLSAYFNSIVQKDVFDLERHPFASEIQSGQRRIHTARVYHRIDYIVGGIVVASSNMNMVGSTWNEPDDVRINAPWGYSDIYAPDDGIHIIFKSIGKVGIVNVHVDANMLTNIVNGEIGNLPTGIGTFYLAGVGKTMDYYITNKDNYLITNSRVTPNKLMVEKGSKVPWMRTLEGQHDPNCIDGVYLTNGNVTTGCREAMGYYQNVRGKLTLGASMPFYDSGWTIVVEQEVDEILSPFYKARNTLIVLGAAITTLLGVLGFLYIRKYITRRLDVITKAMASVSSKDNLGIKIPVVGTDELATMANSFNVMIHRLEDTMQKEMESMAEKEAAIQASKTKSHFLANMSHEIRTPMNAIIGLTYILKRSNLKTGQLEKLNKIDAAATHLLSIINDVLDISKIEAQKLVLDKTDFHLDAIFDHIKSLFTDQAREKGIKVITDATDVPVWLNGDLTRIRQAIINYISNAIKFSDHGEILIRAITVKRKKDKVLIRFEVNDDGVGIEPEKLARIFQPFEQADTSTTRKYGGTGLGLTINRKLAELMGGEIGVESELGKGSCFWFTGWLRVVDSKEMYLKAEDSTDAEKVIRSNYRGARLLLAEDNMINREVATELIESTGLILETAENGLVAVQMALDNEYDLLLMDVQMPEMDGLEATRQIRSHPEKKDLPVLAMTANVFEDDRKACIAAGMNDFVAKPIDPNSLFSTILKWLPKPDPEMMVSAPEVVDSAQDDHQNDENLIHLLQNTPGLNYDKGMRNIGNKFKSYTRLLNKFVASNNDQMTSLSSDIKNDSVDEVLRFAHSLKGVAGNLGLVDIQSAAESLEIAVKSNDAANIEPAISKLQNSYQSFQQVISSADVSYQSKAVSQLDHEELKAIIKELSKLLSKGDTKANDLLNQHEADLDAFLGSDFHALKNSIENFDFAKASEMIDGILQA